MQRDTVVLKVCETDAVIEPARVTIDTIKFSDVLGKHNRTIVFAKLVGSTLVTSSEDRLPAVNSITCLTLDATQEFVITAHIDGSCRAFNKFSGRCSRIFKLRTSHRTRVQRGIPTTCCIPFGEYIFSGDSAGVITWWDFHSGNLLRVFSGQTYSTYDLQAREVKQRYCGHEGAVSGLIAKDGFLYSTSWDGTICIWPLGYVDHSSDVEAIRGIRAHTDRIRRFTLNESETLALTVSCDGTAKAWVLNGPKTVCVRHFEHGSALVDGVLTDRFCFTGAEDGTVLCWDLNGGRKISFSSGYRHVGTVLSMTAASPTLCFSSGADNTVRLWSAAGQCVLALLTETAATAIAFSDLNFGLFACCDDGVIRHWNVKSAVGGGPPTPSAAPSAADTGTSDWDESTPRGTNADALMSSDSEDARSRLSRQSGLQSQLSDMNRRVAALLPSSTAGSETPRSQSTGVAPTTAADDAHTPADSPRSRPSGSTTERAKSRVSIPTLQATGHRSQSSSAVAPQLTRGRPPASPATGLQTPLQQRQQPPPSASSGGSRSSVHRPQLFSAPARLSPVSRRQSLPVVALKEEPKAVPQDVLMVSTVTRHMTPKAAARVRRRLIVADDEQQTLYAPKKQMSDPLVELKKQSRAMHSCQYPGCPCQNRTPITARAALTVADLLDSQMRPTELIRTRSATPRGSSRAATPMY